MAKQGLENLQKKQNITKTTTVSNEPKTSNATNSWGEVRQQTTGVQSTFDPTRITPVSSTRTSTKTIKPQEAVTPKTPTVPGMANSAVSSLVGSNASPEVRAEAYRDTNKHAGNILGNVRASSNKESADTAYMLANLLEGGKAVREQQNEQRLNYYNSRGLEVEQVTPWETGDEITNSLINSLYDRSNRKRDRADELAEDAYTNWGQYETDAGRTIDEVFSNAGSNALRWGKRAALSVLGVPGLDMLSDASMFLSSAGDVLRDARANGADDGNAMAYALATGLANAGFEHLSEASNPFRQNATDLDTFIGNQIKSSNLKPAVQYVANLIAGAGEEGLEEYFTELATQVARRATIGDDQTYAEGASDRVRAFLMGGASALLLGGFVPDNRYSKYREDLAMYYWQMPDAEKGEVIDTLARVFDKDPALLARSIEDHALDALKDMDGETLMRAIDESPIYIDPKTGKSIYEITNYNKDQKAAQKFAQRVGATMSVSEQLDAAEGANGKRYVKNGFVDRNTNNIIINSASKNPVKQTIAHEVAHLGKNTPEGRAYFQTAVDVQKELLGEKGWQDYIKELSDKYGAVYNPDATSFDDNVMEEVGTEFAERMMEDPKVAERVFRRNGNLFQKMYQHIQDAIASYDTTDNLTDEQRSLLKAEKMYSDMINRMSQEAKKDNISGLLQKLNPVISKNHRLTPKLSYSLKSMGIDIKEGTDSEMVRDLLNTGVFQTDEEAAVFVNNVNNLMDLLSQRAFLDMHEEADRDTRAFHPIKKNSDKLYEISLDYSTLCKKRIITQAIIEKLNVERGQALDARTQFAITELLRQYQAEESKLQVACALCYVEAARLKSPKVINQFINNPAKYMTSYFVKQGGSEGKQIVADAQNSLKIMLGVDPKATKQEMADSVTSRMTVGQFNDILKSVGADEVSGDPDAMVTAQKVKNGYNAYAVKLRESLIDTLTDEQKATIELAKDIDRRYFLTADGLTDLKMGRVNGQYNPLAKDIYNAFTNRVTTATRSKAIETDVAYYYGDAKNISDSLIERMNAENGLRTQSWSDFTMKHLLDEITSTAELATRNAKMHGYTKVPEYVLVKGKTGEMINNSLIPAGRTGFDEYGNLAFSPTEGMPIEESNRLREIFPDTDGSICIGINDDQIRALLRDDRIDYVIPYHVSGLTAHLRTIAGINKWSNYTGVQNETPIPGRKQGAAIKFSDWYTDDIKNQDKSGLEIMMDAQQNYLDLCAERGFIPKFPQFLINNGDGTYSIDPESPNYWKLLIDRKMINQLTGKIIEQKAVRPNFNWEDTWVNGQRVPGLFSLVKEAEDPRTSELVERMTGIVRKAMDDGTIDSIAENDPGVKQNMEYFIKNNPIEQLGENEDEDEYEWNGDPFDPETRVEVDLQTEVAPPSYDLQTNVGNQHNDIAAAMFSLSDEELDQQYFDAIDRNDMDEAQRLRLEHAAENGYTDRAYHGTQAFGFTEPDVSYSDDGKSFFVTDDRDVAKTYAGTDVVKPISGNNGTWLDNEIHNTEKQIDASVNDFIDALNQVAGNTNWHPDVSQLNSDLWTIASNYVDNTAVNANSSLSKDIDDELFHWIGKAWQEGNPGENNMMPWLMSSESDYVSEVEDKVIDRFGRFINLINGTDTNRGIYDLVINPDNLLEHDAKGKKWNDLDIINEQGGRTKETTRSLADYAQGEGYNGYVLNNVFDDGGFGATRQQNPATVYDLFDPGSQVKSADTITYDDNGNVIPLSQRDNPNKGDIRYSLFEDYNEKFTDRDGIVYINDVNALTNSDWKTIQKAVDKLGYGIGSAEAAKEVFSRYVPEYGFNAEQSDAIRKAFGVAEQKIKNTNPERATLAKKEFGTTGNFNEAGYLLQDGKMLDFSGKREGGSPNTRAMDHREINRVFDETGDGSASWFMNHFIDEGNIRLMPERGVTIGEIEPTAAQYSVLKRYIEHVLDTNGDFGLDISNEQGYTIASREYSSGDKASRIINDIKAYFKDGELPYRSQFADFRYSLSEDIPEQANAFPDRVNQNRSENRFLGAWDRESESEDPYTYEEVSPEKMTEPDSYKVLMEDVDEDYEAPDPETEEVDFYQSLVPNGKAKGGNRVGASLGFNTIEQAFDTIAGRDTEARKILDDTFIKPLYEAKRGFVSGKDTNLRGLYNMAKKLDIWAGTKESAAAQWLGEGYKTEDGKQIPYTLEDLKKDFPNKWQNIQAMTEYIRKGAEDYVSRWNAMLEQVYPDPDRKHQEDIATWTKQVENLKLGLESAYAIKNPGVAESIEMDIANLQRKIDETQRKIDNGDYRVGKRLTPRKNYFHHFNEIETKGIKGLKNLVAAAQNASGKGNIDPELAGKSEWTQPRSRWMPMLQRRGKGEYTADAVKGFAKYIENSEYAIAFDPVIAHYRDEINKIRKATKQTKNANTMIDYLSDYTNHLAGKTSYLDRAARKILGGDGSRQNITNFFIRLNNRAKSNAVMGNIQSILKQASNLPNGLANVKSRKAWAKGIADWGKNLPNRLAGKETTGAPMDQSVFLNERYFDLNTRDFEARDSVWKKLKGKVSDFSSMSMEILDKMVAEQIWSAAYYEGIEKGVDDPIYYADDLTKRSVAGRGVGEVPYAMDSAVTKFFMPFQVEVNNQWQGLKGMIRNKDAMGLVTLSLAAYAMNGIYSALGLGDVVPSILGAIIDGLKDLFDKDREETAGEVALNTGRRIAGEAVSYMPGTSLWIPAIMSDESSKALFGEADPTRYGTGTVGLSNVAKVAADIFDGDDKVDLMTPLFQLALPSGGRQASRIYNTMQDFNILPSNGWANTPFGGEKTVANGDYSKSGALKYRLPDGVESFDDAMEIAKAFMLGSNATNAAQEYFDNGNKPLLTKERVEKLKENPEVDVDHYIEYLHEANTDGKGGISQREAYKWLSGNEDLTDEERSALWSMTNSQWENTYDTYKPQNETLVENADEDGNGRVTQEEAYKWLSQQYGMTQDEKQAMWEENGWSKSYKKYTDDYVESLKEYNGYTRKDLTKEVDTDESGSMSQEELYQWLKKQSMSEADKREMWKLGGWKSSYDDYKNKESTRASNAAKKELTEKADSDKSGTVTQAEMYAYLMGQNMTDYQREREWNKMGWKTSYSDYKKKHS